MKLLRILLSLAILILMASCEKEIDFNGDLAEPLLVVNSLATPDSTLSVKVTKSVFFLSNQQTYDSVTNATIKIYSNGVFIQNMKHAAGSVYISDYIPEPGTTLRLEVSSPGFEPVWSEIVIPQKVTVLSIDTTSKTEISYYTNAYSSYGEASINGSDTFALSRVTNYKFTINFKDPPEETNYYRITVMTRSTLVDSLKTIMELYPDVNLTDIVFGETTDDENNIFDTGPKKNNFYIFSDELFNGNSYSLKFEVQQDKTVYFGDYKYMNEYDVNKEASKVEMFVDIQAISKSYYLYMKTISNYTEDNSFSEPVQIHSNINGGIGILGAYTNNIASYNLTP